MIVGPWSDVMARAAYSEGIITGVLNPAELEKVRRQLPALDHRRLN
jgi:predicted amidohydrolase